MNILTNTYDEHGLNTEPRFIFNVDTTGWYLNNELGEVLATKGIREDHISLVLKKKSIPVIACCNYMSLSFHLFLF